MHLALNCVQKWCVEKGLSVNANKTGMVLFTKKCTSAGFTAPRLFNTKLKFAHQMKYLGVTLDSKLDWNAHIENRVRKASIATGNVEVQ
jgi:hypothetical protein